MKSTTYGLHHAAAELTTVATKLAESAQRERHYAADYLRASEDHDAISEEFARLVGLHQSHTLLADKIDVFAKAISALASDLENA